MKSRTLFFIFIVLIMSFSNCFADRYILSLELKQGHFTINPWTHAKDAMNAISFELPVDKQFYDSVKPGDRIVDKFRSGSLIFNSSFGKWKMTVLRKRVLSEK